MLDGKTRARYRAPTDEPGAVAVSPDGKYLSVCGRSGKSAYVYDTERGRVAEDTFDDGMGHWDLQFSGDSKGIVFGVFGPTWVDLSDEEEYESDEEVFESRVRVLRKAAAAEVYAFATTDNDLVVATRA